MWKNIVLWWFFGLNIWIWRRISPHLGSHIPIYISRVLSTHNIITAARTPSTPPHSNSSEMSWIFYFLYVHLLFYIWRAKLRSDVFLLCTHTLCPFNVLRCEYFICYNRVLLLDACTQMKLSRGVGFYLNALTTVRCWCFDGGAVRKTKIHK